MHKIREFGNVLDKEPWRVIAPRKSRSTLKSNFTASLQFREFYVQGNSPLS